jgi:hypothetical protein
MAGLIFSDMVLYPLPYSTGIKPRLAVQLRRVLAEEKLWEFWDDGAGEGFGGLLVWACVLGAIASGRMGGGVRTWFVGRLLRAVVSVVMKSGANGQGQRRVVKGCWDGSREGLKEVCERWLWWDYVCGPPAFAVWSEVMALKTRLEQGRGKGEGGDILRRHSVA